MPSLHMNIEFQKLLFITNYVSASLWIYLMGFSVWILIWHGVAISFDGSIRICRLKMLRLMAHREMEFHSLLSTIDYIRALQQTYLTGLPEASAVRK